jgi:phage terminase large subunit
VLTWHTQRLWLPVWHTNAIRAMLHRHNLATTEVRGWVAGADVFSRHSDGTTIAGQYAKLGIKLWPANMDRVNGWAEVLQRLGDGERGIRPTLFIHKRCGRLIETLPALQHDPNRPEDVLKVDADEDGIGGDDAADALRYLVATKAREIVVRKLRGV